MTTEENKGKLQIKKVIFNKAIKSYMQDNYDAGVHFGNMNNNLEEILNDLSLGNVMTSSLKISAIDLIKLSIISENENEFSDFEPYDSFVCTFVAKDNVDSKEFMKGIRKLETVFLNTYNEQSNKEILDIEHQNRVAIRKREIREIIFFIVIAIIAIIIIYLFSKKIF